ncbi:thymidine kinase [Aeromonas phage ZPAH1]|nr:thymidine kinase [Aeromonas phage Aswh_1]QQG34088.1 thymidine kinase [Aeromonas phage ZPAH1]
MASLHFHYAAMNSGKSTHLLQVAHNYEERNMNVLVIKPIIDTRDGDTVSARIGISRPAIMVSEKENLTDLYLSYRIGKKIDCILVDEAQFLTKAQVYQLGNIVDWYGVPVMCYGLLSDSNGELFPGSAALTVLAEKKVEHKTICWCGKKATMNMRIDEAGNKVIGEQVCIGGNDRYVSVCREHWSSGKS